MEENKLISIILPVFNGEKYISSSIESCLNQTYSNIELIIVNDCSTDNTLEIAYFYQKKDTRVRVFSNEKNRKLPASLNIGHELAKGDFITWTSDDNIFKENAIELLFKELLSKKVDFVYSNYIVIDENSKVLREVKLDPSEALLFKNVFGACFLYTKKVYETNKGYDEDLFLVEDYDFWLKTILNFSYSKLEYFMYYYRKHNSTLTNQISCNINKSDLYKKNHMKMLESFFDKLGFTGKSNKLTELILSNYSSRKVSVSSYIEISSEYFHLVNLLYKSNNLFKLEQFKLQFFNNLLHVFNDNINSNTYEYTYIIKNYYSFLSFRDFFELSMRLFKNKLKKYFP